MPRKSKQLDYFTQYDTGGELALLQTYLEDAGFVSKGRGGKFVFGSDNAERLRGTSNADIASGFGGADQLNARGGDDLALGGDGSDHIMGGPGNDIIIGGSDGDMMDGGDGDDTYVINRGDTGAATEPDCVIFDLLGSGVHGDALLFVGYAEGTELRYDTRQGMWQVVEDEMVVDQFMYCMIEITTPSLRSLQDSYSFVPENVVPRIPFHQALAEDEAADNHLMTSLYYGHSQGLLDGDFYNIDDGDPPPVLDVDLQLQLVFILASASADTIMTGDSNDVIVAGRGGDFVDAGDGENFVFGGSGQDAILGGADNDVLLGGADNDEMKGGAGSDIMIGGTGGDMMDGGEGADTYIVSAGDSSAKEPDCILFDILGSGVHDSANAASRDADQLILMDYDITNTDVQEVGDTGFWQVYERGVATDGFHIDNRTGEEEVVTYDPVNEWILITV